MSDAEWLSVDGGGSFSSGTDDLRLYMTSTGALVLKHDGGRATPQTLWTSSPVGHTPHTLEIRFEYNSTSSFSLPDPAWENLTSWAEVYFDGTLVATHGAPGSTYSSNEGFPLGLDNKNGASVNSRPQQ